MQFFKLPSEPRAKMSQEAKINSLIIMVQIFNFKHHQIIVQEKNVRTVGGGQILSCGNGNRIPCSSLEDNKAATTEIFQCTINGFSGHFQICLSQKR